MRALFLLLVASIMSPAVAGTVAVPNTFQPNTPALASEVNANFDALVDALNAQQAAIEQLQDDLASANATISQLQSDLDAAELNVATNASNVATNATGITSNANAITNIESNTVLALDGLLFLGMDAEGNDVARFDEVNVQITNGLGATNGDPMLNPDDPGPVNGLGNLVIGYNEAPGFGELACSDGQFDDAVACVGAGETWAREQRTGSHNLVIGVAQFYSSHGGLLAGERNIVNRAWSSVSGGRQNFASGTWSSVSGGFGNTASGSQSSVSGGQLNTASGLLSSVSGGQLNTASGLLSSVSGGDSNTASGVLSSVSGGRNNTASGTRSSVSGGIAGEETDFNGWCADGRSGTDPCD